MSELNETQEAARRQFERQSGNYGKTHILSNVGDVAAALDFLNLSETGEALDVATGGGHTAIYLAGRGFRVLATDVSQAMLDNTVKLASERGVTVQTALHVAESLPYDGARFDLVTCRVAAHHFSDPAAFVRESARVLKSGGHFILIDGSVPDAEPEAEAWIHQIEKLRDPSHGRFLTANEWKALCVAAGLEVLHCGLEPFKQPDLEWYFEAAATPTENRETVRLLIDHAPKLAREVFQIGNEDGRTVWWWSRLTLIARAA